MEINLYLIAKSSVSHTTGYRSYPNCTAIACIPISISGKNLYLILSYLAIACIPISISGKNLYLILSCLAIACIPISISGKNLYLILSCLAIACIPISISGKNLYLYPGLSGSTAIGTRNRLTVL